VFEHSDKGTPSVEDITNNESQSLCVCSNEGLRDTATRLEIVRTRTPRRVAFVHHVESLLDRAAGNLRQAFRKALSGFEGEPEQLTELLRVVEKAIFDEPVSLDETLDNSGTNRGGNRTNPEIILEPTSLMISARDTSHARRRHRRIFASSDLALIIDALIYRLGQGLHNDTDSLVSVRPSDTDLRDSTEELPPPLDAGAIAKLCRGKINRLFRRMVAQLELTIERNKDATTALIQLAAVLGIVKHLRVRESSFAWLPGHETLIDAERQREFFRHSSRLLYAPGCRLAEIALGEHDHHEFDELTAVRALLAWLALDCGLDTRTALRHVIDDPVLTRDNLTHLGYFLPVITECVSDEFASGILKQVADEQKGDRPACTSYHLAWAKQVVKAADSRLSKPSSVELGDIAVPSKLTESALSIVVDVQFNKSGLLDFDTGEPKYYATGYLKRIQRLQLQ
jgi:hypothetical protein